MGYFSNADIDRSEDKYVKRGRPRSVESSIRAILMSNGYEFREAMRLENYLRETYGDEAMDAALNMFP